MTIRIESMYVSPVKSLRLASIERARLEKPGIAGDRAFHIIDERGKLFTQRECTKFTLVNAAYDVARDELRLEFPDGTKVERAVELGGPTETKFWAGRIVPGRIVEGGFGEALSEFAGQTLRIVKPDDRGASFDGFPISMCSTDSLDALARAAGRDNVDGRRFRQNIYVSGVEPHGEDAWIGETVRVGDAVLRVKMRDERCVMTQHGPDTGEQDLDTLKLIASYRTDRPKEVEFGVYCTVVEEGAVAVGDEVTPLARE
jgi:uncharacterized protein YcbX